MVDDFPDGADQRLFDIIPSELDSDEWKWLASTYYLQRDTYNYDLDFLSSLSSLSDTTYYLKWNLLAAYQELGELGVEFSWKPWAVDEPFVNRRRILDEAVDVMHFIGNMLVGLGVTDIEFEGAYRQKQDKNRRRAASGTYSAKKGRLGEGSEVE